jgi:hypothetical protein
MAMEDERKERKSLSLLSCFPWHATDVEGDEMDRKDRQARTYLMDA